MLKYLLFFMTLVVKILFKCVFLFYTAISSALSQCKVSVLFVYKCRFAFCSASWFSHGLSIHDHFCLNLYLVSSEVQAIIMKWQ